MRTTKRYLITLLFLCSLVPQIHAQQTATGKSAPKLLSREDSLQYAMGVYVGQWILDNGFASFDGARFMSGLEDILKKQPRRISDSLIIPLLNAHRSEVQKALARELETRLFKSIIDTPGLQSLGGSIKYIVRKQGTGLKPREKDSVLISFKGVLADGTVFEDTYEKKLAVVTTPGTLFPGLKQALLDMPAGSVWQLYIPSALAYGETGNGTTVPPAQALIILVSLLEVKKQP